MKKLVLATILATILLVVAVGYVAACCKAQVKVEWDGTQWQYDPDKNDGSVVITGRLELDGSITPSSERLLCWEVVSDTKQLYEIGVKAGTHTDWFFPTDRVQGCYEAGKKDLSNAQFCLEERPTAVRLVEFKAEADCPDTDWPFWKVTAYGILCSCWGWWVGRTFGNKGHGT